MFLVLPKLIILTNTYYSNYCNVLDNTPPLPQTKTTTKVHFASVSLIKRLPHSFHLISQRIQAIELSVLEKMQEKQKQMEEENKRKKAALQETIKKRWVPSYYMKPEDCQERITSTETLQLPFYAMIKIHF